jgi:hypothetical protein
MNCQPVVNRHPERSEASAVRGKMQILASLGMTKSGELKLACTAPHQLK